MSHQSTREQCASVFFVTALTTGLLTFAFTRVASLMRWTPGAAFCLFFGTIGLIFLIMILAVFVED